MLSTRLSALIFFSVNARLVLFLVLELLPYRSLSLSLPSASSSVCFVSFMLLRIELADGLDTPFFARHLTQQRKR